MKQHLTYAFISLAVITGCKSTETAHINKSTSSNFNSGLSDNNNNTVTVNSNNSLDMSEGNHTKLIFDGTDNQVIFEYLNSFFNSKNSRDVIIIEGNGNKVRIVHDGVIDNSVNSTDTIVIKGTASYIELFQQYTVNNSNGSALVDSIEVNKDFRIVENKEIAMVSDSSEIENKLTNQWMTIRDAFNYYLNETIKGNSTAAFYLGELYHMGLGVEVNPKSAVYYYSIAANNGNIKAQSILGHIYESDYIGVGQDLNKSEYWYTKAAANGDSYAAERLNQIK